MPLTKEQASAIKGQLLLQVDKLPQENKEQIKQYISQLNEEQLEQFLKQNKIQISQQSTKQPLQTQCIFCSITKNETPSYKIAENKKAIAILEINPLSKGHVLILPIEHTTIEKIPGPALSLAQKITRKIKTKFRPEDVKIETSSFQGHAIINVIPFYKDQKIEKRKASEAELKQLQSKLEIKKRILKTTRVMITKKQIAKLPEISFRIP